MPTLPTINAGGGGSVAGAITPEAFGAGAFRELAGLGSELQEVGKKITETSDSVEINKLKGEYEAGVRQIALEIDNDPDYEEYSE